MMKACSEKRKYFVKEERELYMREYIIIEEHEKSVIITHMPYYMN